jgi:virulence-associated protein VapD
MFAIAFDLTVRDAEAHHPKSATQAYTDIARAVRKYGFARVQGSVYVGNSDNLADLTSAMTALKAMPWFPLGGTRHSRFQGRELVRFHAFHEGDVLSATEGPNGFPQI